MGFDSELYKGLPLGGAVKNHLGRIGGVEAIRMAVMFDGIGPSSFGATYWSFPSIHVSVEVINHSHVNREADMWVNITPA